MPTEDSLGVEPMCRLAQVSRAGFYRYLQPRHPGEEDMEVRNAIQQIVLEHHRRYGYRRVAVELRRRGMAVNHKRVLRLMREDNLLGIEPKAFVVTTDSDHDQQVYLNLARRMKLTAINQLWVADITYIRLASEFVYLAVVLDVFSRKVVGWALDRTLTTRLPLLALERAIALRQPAPGLVHHSDRGVQYASRAVHQLARNPWHPAQHEPPRQPLRQRLLRELHQDPQARADLRPQVPVHRRAERPSGRVHRAVLQSATAALCPGIQDPGGVRSRLCARGCFASAQREFSKA